MSILIISPVSESSRKGNRITTERWNRILTSLGHDVTIRQTVPSESFDVMIALHAKKSADAIRTFHEQYPRTPIVLALTGTDIYRDFHQNDQLEEVMHIADQLIVLQSKALNELPDPLHEKTRVIHQSITFRPNPMQQQKEYFEIAVIGHLREVKDPLRPARASRQLPPQSNIQITHLGGVLEQPLKKKAQEEASQNPRYHWMGEKPRVRTLQILARSKLLVHPSRLEGGAHVISEALACNTPVLASDIPGNIGILGEDYPGYFPVEDTDALTRLMIQAENQPYYYSRLQQHIHRRSALVDPTRERRKWERLLSDIVP